MEQKYLIIVGPNNGPGESLNAIPFTVQDDKIIISLEYVKENDHTLYMLDDDQLKQYFSI